METYLIVCLIWLTISFLIGIVLCFGNSYRSSYRTHYEKTRDKLNENSHKKEIEKEPEEDDEDDWSEDTEISVSRIMSKIMASILMLYVGGHVIQEVCKVNENVSFSTQEALGMICGNDNSGGLIIGMIGFIFLASILIEFMPSLRSSGGTL